MKSLNKALETGNVEECHGLLMKPEALLPTVLNRSSYLYYGELKKEKTKKEEVCVSKTIQIQLLSIIVFSRLELLSEVFVFKTVWFAFFASLYIITLSASFANRRHFFVDNFRCFISYRLRQHACNVFDNEFMEDRVVEKSKLINR